MMDSTKQSTDSNHIMDRSQSKQSGVDYGYQDDFEEKSKDPSESLSNRSSESKSSAKEDVFHKGDGQSDTDTHVEKGQRESSGQIPMEKDKATPGYDDLQSDDSEPEPEPEGDVLFTEDRQRAMMELMAQKHDSGDYTGDPPEYNVKERLKELNAELAKEPDPNDRQHKVGFKRELVDLVAPPPEISDDDDDDDDDSPRKTFPNQEERVVEKEKADPDEGQDSKKQFVVERDGKFDIVSSAELSASERAMLNVPDDDGKDDAKGKEDAREEKPGRREQQGVKGAGAKETVPQPPSMPRPNTTNGHFRRNVHLPQSPRPQTAASFASRSSMVVINSNHGSALWDFNYNSPYAMSSTEKERAQERARLKEQQKKEEARHQKEEEEYRRRESEDAFRAWLQHKSEDYRRKRQEEEKRRKRNGEKEEWKTNGYEQYEEEEDGSLNTPSSESFELSLQPKAKENGEAFRGWLNKKQAQLKREKLLKKREEQTVKESYFVRRREECDLAYREWLKKKYSEYRQQRTAEKERQRCFSSMARKARKQQMIARAVRQSTSFRYPDVYGYRF